MILGITGSIAAGKSKVSELFRQLGAKMVSADQLAREVVSPGSAVLRQLTEHFGAEILRPDGSLDRKALADRVFSDPEARGELNRIIHPAIAEMAARRLRAAERENELVVYEAPLLFETGAEKRVDAVLTVRVDKDVQLRRLMRRDRLSEAEALERVTAQMPQEEKVARSDYVIDNSGPFERTEVQVRELFNRLKPDSPAEGDG